jgi:hypothetical protein
MNSVFLHLIRKTVCVYKLLTKFGYYSQDVWLKIIVENFKHYQQSIIILYSFILLKLK